MRAKLEVTLTTEFPVHGTPSESPDFFYEEHLCLDDVLDHIMCEVERALELGGCTCYRGKIKFLEYTE